MPNPVGLEFYDRLVDGLLAAGITLGLPNGLDFVEPGDLVREVMLSQNDTKFALTDDNHKLVDLGQYTAADVEHSYSRPPSAPSSGGSK